MNDQANLEAAALRKAVIAMRAFTDPEGNMPADTGEFRDLKDALSDAEAVLSCEPPDHQCCGKCEKPARDDKTAHAIGVLTAAVKADPDYAWGWHCNIAMSAVDAGCPHQVANEGAARFMSLLFGVDTRAHPGFPKPAVDATEPRQATPEEYQAAINQLVQRLQTADAVITALVIKAGGDVSLNQEDAAAAAGLCVVSDVSEDRTAFNFRAVSVSQPAETVQ